VTVCEGHLWEVALNVDLCVSFNNMWAWKSISKKAREINSTKAYITNYEAFG
jgi:hypothetical protein